MPIPLKFRSFDIETQSHKPTAYVTECTGCGNICHISEDRPLICPVCGPDNDAIVKTARYSDDPNVVFRRLQNSLVAQASSLDDEAFLALMKSTCDSCMHQFEDNFCKPCAVTLACSKRKHLRPKIEMDSETRRQNICDMLTAVLQEAKSSADLISLKYEQGKRKQSTVTATFDDRPSKRIEIPVTTDADMIKAITAGIL